MKTSEELRELGLGLMADHPKYKQDWGDDAEALGRAYYNKHILPFEKEEPAEEPGPQTYSEIDPEKMAWAALPSFGRQAWEAGKGLVDIGKQVVTTPPSEGVLASLAKLGTAGAEVFMEEMTEGASPEGREFLGKIRGEQPSFYSPLVPKLPVEGEGEGVLSSGAEPRSWAEEKPIWKQAAREMGAEFTESFEPAAIEEDPFRAIANALSVTPTRGLLKGLAGSARYMKMPRAVEQLEKARRTIDWVDPTTAGLTAVTRIPPWGWGKTKKFWDRLRQNPLEGDAKSLWTEYGESAVAFSTSKDWAVPELRELAALRGDDWVNRFRAFRSLPRGELMPMLLGEIVQATKSLRKKAQDSYKAGMGKLAGRLEEPFTAATEDGAALERLKQGVIDSIEKRAGAGSIQRIEGIGYTQSGARGGTTVKYKVIFGDDSGIDTSYRKAIAQDIEAVLNWNPSITGKQIHDWRRKLDQSISRMPSPTDAGGNPSTTQQAFAVRSLLRRTIADNVEKAYGEEYTKAMGDYRKVIEMQEDMHNAFKVTGTSVDKATRETILGELSNTYNPTMRQALRPQLLREFEEMSGNKNILAMVHGGLFAPFVSKGLAQRAELAQTVSILGGVMTGVMTGDPVTGGMVIALMQIPQQALYNPRVASEILVSLSRHPKTPGLKAQAQRLITKAAREFKALPAEHQSVLKSLSPNTPLKIALERLAEARGFDLTDPYAAIEALHSGEVPSEEGRFLSKLGKVPGQAGLTPPSG